MLYPHFKTPSFPLNHTVTYVALRCSPLVFIFHSIILYRVQAHTFHPLMKNILTVKMPPTT